MADQTAQDLLDFIEASPSPYHCVAEAARRLEAAGFVAFDPAAAPGRIAPGSLGYVANGGSIIAWRAGSDAPAAAGFRLVGAHTDSPNLRVKPRPDTRSEGFRRLGVEVYGGAILATWADRDLGLSGAVAVQGEQGVERRLLRVDRPIGRVPNLAIHLNRSVNSDGLKLDPQKHLPVIVGLGDGPDLHAFVAAELGVDAEAILSWDLGFHDVVPPTTGGMSGEFLFAPRMDDQFSAGAGLFALLAAPPARATQVLTLFDHEEVGSRSATGAAGPLLRHTLQRIVRDHTEVAPGGLERAASNSWMVSADMAHGVHPNFPELHEPGHKPLVNGGPVLKGNVEQRYATDLRSGARFRAACATAGVPCQDFITRTDLACGTTIGPIAAAELGISTADVGGPLLSMHSARELCGTEDVRTLTQALTVSLLD